jgi:hypothetical protein
MGGRKKKRKQPPDVIPGSAATGSRRPHPHRSATRLTLTCMELEMNTEREKTEMQRCVRPTVHTPCFLSCALLIGPFPFTFIVSPFRKIKKTATFPISMAVAAFTTTRLPLAFSGDNHLCFLRPRALTRLRNVKLRRWTRASRPPLPSSLEPAPTPSSSPPPAAGDHEGVAVVLYFALTSRLRVPRCS